MALKADTALQPVLVNTRLFSLNRLSFLVVLLVLVYISWSLNSSLHSASFSHLAQHCKHTPPISIAEFHHRMTMLVKALRALDSSAYIAEPGASAAYYANISQSQWKLSERPLLLIMTPDGPNGQVIVLTPKFEATRARNLRIPFDVRYVEWPEDESPYSLLASSLSNTEGSIFLDGSIRKFLCDGLQEALPNATITTAPYEVTQLRERKSVAEINILRCANEGRVTLLAIREVHKRLYIGLRESQARSLMASALLAAGLQDGGCLTIRSAALPHGSGTDRVLNKSDFALFDCTASLHGYYSDVTRTVALPSSKIPEKHQHIWNYVHSAQSIALRTAHKGVLTHTVDAAARSFLDTVDYASYFTHRLGHGIGLEVHEEPYLRGGSKTVILSGHTFSNEPGVYIEGEVGVRLEDCFFINEEGNPVLLTEGVGGQSKSSLLP